MPNFNSTKILGDLIVTGDLKSTVLTGTAPLVVASSTLVTNLNAQYLNGQLGSYYASAASIGNGTVTLAAGNGLVTGGSFTTNQSGNSTVTFDMGTPGNLSSASTSTVSADSHTHAITNYSLSGTANQISVSGTPKVLGSATTLSLPQDIATTSAPTFGRMILSQGMIDGTNNAFVNPNLVLASTNTVDTTGFIGMTFATSSSANYGYSLGALRTTNGGGNMVIRNHFSDAAGVEVFRLGATGTITLPTSGKLTTSTGPLFLSTSGGNGDITIDPNGSGRLIHTKALASKGTTYTHTWMQFDEDVNGNALYLGSGALTVLGAGESITSIKGQIGATTEALVFGSDESTTSTAFRFIGSLQSGWAGRTEVLGITGAGNATLLGDLTTGGDLIVNGGDIKQTAKTGTDQVGGSLIVASGQGTGAGTASTIKFQTPTTTTSGTATQALADRLTITSTGVTISGILQVDGTTQTINSTIVTLDDPVITLGGDTAPTVDDNKDRGIEYRWHNGSAAKLGFFGYDDSIDRFTFIPDATNTSEVFSGTLGDARFNSLELVGGSNIGIFTPTSLTATRTYTFPDATGTVALTSDLHTRSHTMTSTSDHTAGNWKLFHSNGSGQVIELALGTAGHYLRAGGAAAAPTFAQIAYSEISGTPSIPTGFSISAGATDGIFDITGTGGTNSVSYSFAPYASKQATLQHFYLGTTNPDQTTRLNLDANLYATNLYSGGNIVYTSANLPAYPTVGDGTLSWTTSTAGATNTTIAASLSGAYSANTSNNRTMSLAIGPALTNLATTMTGDGAGFLKKTAADTYSIDTTTYYHSGNLPTYPTVNDASLTLTASTGATNTAVTIGTGTGFTANDSTNTTYDIDIGPALTNLSGIMTGAGSGFLKKTAQDTYSIDTNTYLTSYTESDTFQTVTTRGNTTSTSVSITNSTGSINSATGALLVTGGVGIGEKLYTAGNIYASQAASIANPELQVGPGTATGIISVKLRSTGVEGYLQWLSDTDNFRLYTSSSTLAPLTSGILTATSESALTNTSSYPLVLDHQTSGTPANGIGTGIQFKTETAAGNTEIGATIESVTTDVASTSEDFDLVFKTMTAGSAATEKVRISSLGNMTVSGTLFATAKSFQIDHPTKPNMKLRYGSLEGPENGVYVRGKLKDSNIIELPDYWTGLIDADSITVNLTPIGSFQKLYVEKIENNKIYIANQNVLLHKEINCYYTVFAERNDIERLKVEIENNN